MERCKAHTVHQNPDLTIILRINEQPNNEGFSIEEDEDGNIRITGNSMLGLMYGLVSFYTAFTMSRMASLLLRGEGRPFHRVKFGVSILPYTFSIGTMLLQLSSWSDMSKIWHCGALITANIRSIAGSDHHYINKTGGLEKI